MSRPKYIQTNISISYLNLLRSFSGLLHQYPRVNLLSLGPILVKVVLL